MPVFAGQRRWSAASSWAFPEPKLWQNRAPIVKSRPESLTAPSGASMRPRTRRLAIDGDGRATLAAQIPSPNCDKRPHDTPISLIVVHGISLPPGEFDGDGIERLFTNRLDPAAHPY